MLELNRNGFARIFMVALSTALFGAALDASGTEGEGEDGDGGSGASCAVASRGTSGMAGPLGDRVLLSFVALVLLAQRRRRLQTGS